MAKCTGIRCPMQHPYKVDECNNTDCQYRTEPITNAERIRAMSVEELAEIIMCPYGSEPDLCCTKGTCLDCCEKWLKHPAE